VAQSAGPVVDKPADSPLQLTEDGQFWMDVVQHLVDTQAIQSLTRELALQSQLVARDEQAWLLRIERESLQAGQTRDKLEQALAKVGHPVSLTLEMGRVTDSPAKRLAQAARERQLKALQLIEQDPYVLQLMQRYDAKIVSGSIQPT
jgi:DNA polymerase-3 subunit gamma/tau